MNIGRNRRSTPLDENSNPDTVDMQPGNAKVPRLRRSRSLRVLYDGECSLLSPAALHGALEMRLARTYGKCVSKRVITVKVMAKIAGYDGADEVEVRGFDDGKVEVRGFDDGNRAVNARNGRCQREILDYRQKLLYYANFKLHFGISDEMCGFMENFCDVMTSCPGALDPIRNGLVSLAHDAQERFGLLKFYYCNACDRHLPGPKALCQNEGCQLRGVPPKRSKTSKRTSIFTVLNKIQLHIILERVLPLLTELHDSIHNRDQSDDNPVLSETSSFPKYDRDIESVLDFRDRKITIALTLNVDGVRFKKLSRSESWHIYIRLEGLPFKEKNKYENVILAGIMFTRKPPTETLLVELFSGLKHELEVLQREGIPIHTASDTWICTPKLVNGIIDFAALQALYGLPRWQSLQGCHLCMFSGERVGRRVLWFNRFPDPHDRRTDESLIMDAEARQNGPRGWTQMMDFFTVNHCMPDALHLHSEGITENVFEAMFGPRRGAAVMAIRRDCIGALLVALQRTRNYMYSSKFILGVEDLSRCTGSEKEALSFVVFPLAAALNMFSESVRAVAVLAYWMLVRVLENTKELTAADFPGVRDLGNSMKNLWYALDPTLITLKVHCLVDHAVLEDLPRVGSPYHWSSSSFESIHRRLQLCVPQCTTNLEETIIENFLLHKDMVDKLEKEVKIYENDYLDRLHKKIVGQGKRPRCNVSVGDFGLEGDWYVPADSVLAFEALGEEHREFLLEQSLSQRFSSRLSDGNHMYASSDYWKKSVETDTTQGIVYLETPDGEARFGQIIAFGFDSFTGECCVLLDEFVTTDPFAALYEKVFTSPHPAHFRACSALQKIQDNNRYFLSVQRREIVVRSAYDIRSPAVLIQGADFCFVSRV